MRKQCRAMLCDAEIGQSLFVHFKSQQLRRTHCHEVPKHVRKQAVFGGLRGAVRQGRAKMCRSYNESAFILITYRRNRISNEIRKNKFS